MHLNILGKIEFNIIKIYRENKNIVSIAKVRTTSKLLEFGTNFQRGDPEYQV